MSSHTTVLHLPVTFVTPAGTTPESFAQYLADEAALEIEKMTNAEDITVGQVRIDPVIPAFLAAAAADSRPDWWCAHHGEDGMDTDPEPWCHGCVEAGVTTAPMGGAR